MSRRDKYSVPGADQRAQWKKALADHNRGKRTRRSRRPGPPIVGIRIMPAPPKEKS